MTEPELLPARLGRRARRLNTQRAGTGPVVYWMRTAVRAHENPALDVAIHLANARGVPVFVYQAVSERYPYASDRHHRFLLEGARDVAHELAIRGIEHRFHLERPGHRGPHLYTLAERCSALVTEDLPVDPLRRWTRSLADAVQIPVFAVDTATVVPMRLVGKGVDRAYAYKKRIQRHLHAELAPWDEVEPARSEVPPLPFDPLELHGADLAGLIATCCIDHTVPPVFDTPGGSTAGYARWEAFRDQRLARYAWDRNDPLRDGSSRMSAYLHLGMVAPLRLAREATALGAHKFVEELVVWRELPHTWCLYAREHHTLAAIPAWASATLAAHATDPRPPDPGTEALQLGRTGAAIWDVAQRSLLRRGELHNNVRMTWGKALIPWSADALQALERLVDLNHRYALDGRDPASYGGLLWVLGQFDRPFDEGPVFGTVRPRPLEAHAERLDVEAWRAKLEAPRELKVAVIGPDAGAAFAGFLLALHGAEVVWFDEGDPGEAPVPRDPRLARWQQGWMELGLDTTEALLAHLGRGSVRQGDAVTGLVPTDGGWTVTTTHDWQTGFAAVVSTAAAVLEGLGFDPQPDGEVQHDPVRGLVCAEPTLIAGAAAAGMLLGRPA